MLEQIDRTHGTLAAGDSTLNALVSAVRKSKKYRHVTIELVRRIGARELTSHPALKDAIKASKSKLHQVGAAYFCSTARYSRWLAEIAQAQATGDPEVLKRSCRHVMAAHASTRERLPILEHVFHETLCDLAPIRSVQDLACGLNPLAIPWMPLAPRARYYAYDIYEDLNSFLGSALPLLGVSGQARTADLAHRAPNERTDVALLLKTIPCLEQLDKGAARRLLERITAPTILVSFPVASFGGRDKGMVSSYERRMEELLRGGNWTVRRFQFETELIFRLTRTDASQPKLEGTRNSDRTQDASI